MVIKELLSQAVTALTSIPQDERINEAFILLSFITKKNKSYLLTHMDETLSKDAVKNYRQCISLRNTLMPISYITKEAYFLDLILTVEPGVLIPRGDSEIVIEATRSIPPSDNVLDLCCGSGVLGIAYAYENKEAHVTIVDIDDTCIVVSKKNITTYQLQNRVSVIKSDLFTELSTMKFDLIISNPPYIKTSELSNLMIDVKDYEPHLALDGKEDGLYFYKKIITNSHTYLQQHGYLVLEIGFDQKEEVTNILLENGYTTIKCYQDYQKNDRVLVATS